MAEARAGATAVHDVRSETALRLAELGRELHARGWVLGTSGNFSAVLSRDPLRVAITPRGADKGRLDPAQILEVDAGGRAVAGAGRPSDETRLHLAVVAARGAGAVLHTHSVWATLLSEAHAAEGGLAIEGYEMLKGLEGVGTHAHREWVPILENSQDWAADAPAVEGLLRDRPEAHAFLIRGHGLYTWGRDLAQARRHLEVMEFLLEVVGRAGRRA
jgi:methylthioribulose-1-phosphate dehydratase